MKALFVGLGSIGSRHLANLVAVAGQQGLALEVSALRAIERPLPAGIAAQVHHQLDSLPPATQYDVAFITNPTHLHAEAIARLKGRVGTFFIEKPIFDAPGRDLDALGLGAQQKAYVAAPMRFTALYAALKEALAALPVYAVRVLCSSYLPGWRAGADYRASYSAHSAMGGGVTLDLIHEWDYLVDLFGLPLESCNYRGRFSALEIDSDDLSVYIARYQDFLCEVHLDYFGRSYRRTLEAFCEAGTLLADFGTGRLTLPNGTVQDHEEAPNARYLREMAYFVRYALGGAGESANSPRHAQAVLALALEGRHG
ncbi:MAG: Gfo/Idh/MocA family oxidoreductase [Oscillospiraceae bacterium]